MATDLQNAVIDLRNSGGPVEVQGGDDKKQQAGASPSDQFGRNAHKMHKVQRFAAELKTMTEGGSQE